MNVDCLNIAQRFQIYLNLIRFLCYFIPGECSVHDRIGLYLYLKCAAASNISYHFEHMIFLNLFWKNTQFCHADEYCFAK